MADPDYQTEAGAECVGIETPEGIMNIETLLDKNLSQKAMAGDGGDVSSANESSLQDCLMQNTEADDGMSVNDNRRFNKGGSPPAKRSSKRKRKNRRRREKKATVATAAEEAMLKDIKPDSSRTIEDGTGTETEFSQNSENVNKEDDTGTESESAYEGELELSSICVETSLQNTTNNILMDQNNSMKVVGTQLVLENDASDKVDENIASNVASGSIQSVETVLHNARCKIISQILDPSQTSVDCSEKRKTDLQNDSSSKLVVPPCSPSSLHSISNVVHSTETVVAGTVPISPEQPQTLQTLKTVHFQNGPPKIVSLDANPSEEQIFELNLQCTTTVPSEGEREAVIDMAKTMSRETVTLIGNVAKIDSVTSSISSNVSGASLLKGHGSSIEDFTESSNHYPSRETVEDSDETQQSHSLSELKVDNFRETIQIFKIQNPLETQYIGNEVDSILINSLDKFTTLMESIPNEGDDGVVPTLVSRTDLANIEGGKVCSTKENINKTSFSDNIPSPRGIQKPLQESHENSYIDDHAISDEEVDDNSVVIETGMNTTFTIERVDGQYDENTHIRPFSPGEVIPKAIPDTVSDTESIETRGLCLSMVREEDEDEYDVPSNISRASRYDAEKIVSSVPPSQTVSTASTVIEVVLPVQLDVPENSINDVNIPRTTIDLACFPEESLETPDPPTTVEINVDSVLASSDKLDEAIRTNDKLNRSDEKSIMLPGVTEDDSKPIVDTSNILDGIIEPPGINETIEQKLNILSAAVGNGDSPRAFVEKQDSVVTVVHSHETDTLNIPAPSCVLHKENTQSFRPITPLYPDSETESATDESRMENSYRTSDKDDTLEVKLCQVSHTSECEDLNEWNIDATSLNACSRPSTGTTNESGPGQTESDFIMEEGRVEAKQSIEVFTLHFPSTSDAPPSENNLNSNEQPPSIGKGSNQFHSAPDVFGKHTASRSAPNRRNDEMIGTETDSDYPWRPERKNSLRQVIQEKENHEIGVHTAEGHIGENVMETGEQLPIDNGIVRDEETDTQDCSCAKMCIIS